MKHHEVIIDFNRRGMVEIFRRLINRKRSPASSAPYCGEESRSNAGPHDLEHANRNEAMMFGRVADIAFSKNWRLTRELPCFA